MEFRFNETQIERYIKNVSKWSSDLMRLKLSDISKIYPNGFQALSKISFEVHKSQVYGLVGPNGSGKTTLIKIIKGILKPTSGTLSINKMIYNSSSDRRELKKLSGYLAENPMLLPFLTINEYLEIISILYEVPKHIADKRIDNMITLFGLNKRINDRIDTLSEGMKQKVQWIATLVNNAPFILLDDPLRALDLHSFELIVSLIRKLKELDKTIVVATHYLSLVEKTCDMVAFLQDGQIKSINSMTDFSETKAHPSIYEHYLNLYPNPIDEEDFKRIEF